MKIKILLNFHGKYSNFFFREIDLFDFKSLFDLVVFNFLAHCESRNKSKSQNTSYRLSASNITEKQSCNRFAD